jgi:hypothetical protein
VPELRGGIRGNSARFDWTRVLVAGTRGTRSPATARSAGCWSESEVVKLRRHAPELEAMCGELAGYTIPDSLEHGDLWGVNVIAGADACVFIGWEDASLSHPFFSPSLLLLSLNYTEALAHVPDARARIREAYLRPWRAAACTRADRLEPAFDLAQRVAMLHYAVQFRRFALPRIETSWEVKAFAPLFLKRLIEHE